MIRRPIVQQKRIILVAITLTSLLFTEYSINALSQVTKHADVTKKVVPTQDSRPGTTEFNPCRQSPKSTECLNYRIKQLETRLASIEEALPKLAQRPNPGPPVADLPQRDGKADGPTVADIHSLQHQIDSLWGSVEQLIKRTKE